MPRSAPSPGAGPSGQDPGEELREQARDVLGRARDRLETQGDRSASAVRAAQEHAPDEPGLFSRAMGQLKEFGKGAWEATVELGEFAYKMHPIYLLTDPTGFFEHKKQLVEGIVYGVQNPKEFAKAVLDWETWKENPARALGHLVPDLVAAVFTAGGAAAATRGAKAARELEDAAAAARRAEEAAAAARRVDPPTPPGAPSLSRSQRETVDAYAAAAARTEPRITQALQDIQAAVPGARMEGLDFRLKTPDSLARKVAGDMDPGDAVQDVLADINDAVRYTYVADSARYADAATDVLTRLETKGFEPVKPPKNTWSQPGYQGINSTWRDPETGQTFEVQVHTPESLSAKEQTHPLYEEQRLLPRDDPRWLELERSQREIFEAVPRPEGAADVRRTGAGR